MSTTDDTVTTLLATALDAWSGGIARHDSIGVARGFAEDALFQGFDPTHSIGRDAIAAYYEKQPVGLTAAYTILNARSLAPDAVVGYASVAFTRPEGVVIDVHLTVVLRRIDDAWAISHYHVSKIAPDAARLQDAAA